MVWYSVFVIVFSMSKFPWIRSSRVLENVIDTKMPLILYYCWHSLIYHCIPHDRQITTTRVINKKYFISQVSFILFRFKSIYLKYIQYIQSRKKFEPSISKDMWPHVFRSKVRSYFPCFLVTYLAYTFFLLIWDNFLFTLKTGRCWNPLSVDS